MPLLETLPQTGTGPGTGPRCPKLRFRPAVGLEGSRARPPRALAALPPRRTLPTQCDASVHAHIAHVIASRRARSTSPRRASPQRTISNSLESSSRLDAGSHHHRALTRASKPCKPGGSSRTARLTASRSCHVAAGVCSSETHATPASSSSPKGSPHRFAFARFPVDRDTRHTWNLILAYNTWASHLIVAITLGQGCHLTRQRSAVVRHRIGR